MDDERERGFPEAVALAENVEGEDADKRGEQEAQHSGRPEQEAFDVCFHKLAQEDRASGVTPPIDFFRTQLLGTMTRRIA